MCGEHASHASYTLDLAGSSPHVRGALAASVLALSHLGIIPACAGSTHTCPCGSGGSRDHPRMCGEHRIIKTLAVKGRGSSPHVRGALRVTDRRDRAAGIIPACAGSTDIALRGRWDTRDHPRMCGEHLVAIALSATWPGSSPHVRGALTISKWKHRLVGIIPACAGSTAIACRSW